MNASISGIHHLTAITGDAQANVDFYTGVLGLRLVKVTVNFDDPSSYHLYYGDDLGRPGTIMTFFAWPGAHRGRIGPPQVTTTAFAAPADALKYWADRLSERGIGVEPIQKRFDEQVLGFTDPDGMQLEIIGVTHQDGHAWSGGSVPPQYAIRGFHSVTLSEQGYENTANLLTQLMGFTSDLSDQNRFRYRGAGDDRIGSIVDLLCVPAARDGRLGAGIVHHVAFRTPDDTHQQAWRETIVRAGHNVSPIMERVYFKSIYFREPGGVLFEIATDTPGFVRDEQPNELGKRLMLPPWLESHRPRIEQALPPLRLTSVRPRESC